MTIRNLQHFTNSLWDWSVLDGCFGSSKIQPCDLDGVVEYHGCFLVLEAKSPGARVPFGQQRMLDAFVATGAFTVIILWGKPGRPEEMEVLGPLPYGSSGRKKATLEDLRRVVRWWFEYASRQGGKRSVC